MFWSNLKSAMESLLRGMREEVRRFPHLALTSTLFAVACLWWVLKRQTATKQIEEVRGKQVAIEKEYNKTMKAAEDLREDEKRRLTECYLKEIQRLREVDAKIDDAVNKGPVGIASEWAEYLGAKR